jgi:hypothetical protein
MGEKKRILANNEEKAATITLSKKEREYPMGIAINIISTEDRNRAMTSHERARKKSFLRLV